MKKIKKTLYVKGEYLPDSRLVKGMGIFFSIG